MNPRTSETKFSIIYKSPEPVVHRFSVWACKKTKKSCSSSWSEKRHGLCFGCTLAQHWMNTRITTMKRSISSSLEWAVTESKTSFHCDGLYHLNDEKHFRKNVRKTFQRKLGSRIRNQGDDKEAYKIHIAFWWNRLCNVNILLFYSNKMFGFVRYDIPG